MELKRAIMKKKLLIITAILFLSQSAFSQFSFSVSPGLNLNTAYFGYKLNRIVPFVGFQYFGTSVNYEYNHKVFDYDLGEVVDHNHSSSGKVSFMIPNLGVKYFLIDKGNLKASATVNITKPILTAEAKIDGQIDEFVEESVKAINLFGGEMSFGAEYFFDEHFSLGGEFGIRYIHFDYKITNDEIIFNPMTGEEIQTQSSYSTNLNMSPTFSKITLNFYF